jgi:hypothetical protein
MQCRRTVSLDTLPEYGLFWTLASGRRGLIKSWHYKERKKWSAVCLLFEYAGRLGRSIGRHWIRAQASVAVSPEDDIINTVGRGDTGDSFLARPNLGTGDTTYRKPARAARRKRTEA